MKNACYYMEFIKYFINVNSNNEFNKKKDIIFNNPYK
jgi:hypothetical protein